VALVGEPAFTICAFCLMTSAGVRMAHETSSARDEAPAWTTAMGRTPLGDAFVVLSWVKSVFVRSYVVKNAPAETCQTKSSRVRAKNGKLKCRKVDFLHEGKVAIITLPSPWYTPRNNAGFGFPVEALV
jgi:hypothetical protein